MQHLQCDLFHFARKKTLNSHLAILVGCLLSLSSWLNQALEGEFQGVDGALGSFEKELKAQGLWDSVAIVQVGAL